MRPIMKIALCAVVAAGVAAPAASSDYFLKLGGVKGESAKGSERHKDQIEILSWSWGETRVAGDPEYGWKVEEGESAPPAPGGAAKFGAVSGAHRDESIKGSKIGQNAPAATVGGSEKLTVGGARTESRPPRSTGWYRQKPVVGAPRAGTAIGKAIGNHAADGDESASAPAEKRQHGWTTVSKPLDRGAVRVKVKFPWLDCKVGARYPVITLGDGANSQRLQDVTVASCSGPGDEGPEESITFVYGKLG